MPLNLKARAKICLPAHVSMLWITSSYLTDPRTRRIQSYLSKLSVTIVGQRTEPASPWEYSRALVSWKTHSGRQYSHQVRPDFQAGPAVSLEFGAQVMHVAACKCTCQNRPPCLQAVNCNIRAGIAVKMDALNTSTTVCAACGSAAADLKRCGRCLSVVYCGGGKACQHAHWKARGGHKDACTVLTADAAARVQPESALALLHATLVRMLYDPARCVRSLQALFQARHQRGHAA